MIDWKVGDKVVCVDASNYKNSGEETALIINNIYTIAVIDLAKNISKMYHSDDLCICVNEIHSSRGGKGPNGMPVFFASRFRPLIDEKKTTEFFEKLCLDATKKMELVG